MMNVNAPVFVPQNMTSKASSSSPSHISRVQGSSGPMHQHDMKWSGSRNQNHPVQGDQNARLNVNNKRNNNPHRKKNRQPHYQRNQADTGAKDMDTNGSNPSGSDIEANKAEGSQVSVTNIASALNDLSLTNADPALHVAPNKRGQISLNHLLNFSFPPRQRFAASTPRKQRAVNYQPFNKERFFNANFRFLVNSTGDYTVYHVDPDLLLQWENIEQVIITTHSTPSCPICLQQPTAARVTKCGHTYCLACILHYLLLSDDKDKPNKKWRKCPICWDAVYAKDLKSVRFWSVRNIGRAEDGSIIRSDEMITMRLIQRSANSTTALPRSSTWPINNDTTIHYAPWHFTPNALAFSKLIFASLDYMHNEYSRDLNDLERALQEAKEWNSSEEIPFLEMAIVNIKEHLEHIRKSSTFEILQAERRARELCQILEDKSTIQDEPYYFTSIPQVNDHTLETSPDSIIITPDFLPDEFKEHPHIINIRQEMPEPKFKTKALQPATSKDTVYNFYQSEDGQHVYLHPLDIRILKQEFGAYERFPSEISVRIVGIEESTITEELRKRYKYLSHLPLSCDVTFLEVDLKGVVSDSTLQIFANELRQRRNCRNEKARKEEQQHKKAVYKSTQQELFNSDPFFQYNTSYEAGGGNNVNVQSSDSNFTETMLGDSNIRINNTDPSNGPKTVWGTPAVSFANVTSGRSSVEESDIVENGWDFKEEEVSLGKKHKKKKLVLLSTGGRRRQ